MNRSVDIKIGDRVIWESQAAGSWKRKSGKVTGVRDKHLKVAVDIVVGYNPYDKSEIGERERLKAPRLYFPYRRQCRKI